MKRIRRWWINRQRRKAGEAFIAQWFASGPTFSFEHNGHVYVAYSTGIGWIGGSLTAKVFSLGSTYAEFWERMPSEVQSSAWRPRSQATEHKAVR